MYYFYDSFFSFIVGNVFLLFFTIVLLLFNLIIKQYFNSYGIVNFNICFSFLCLFFVFILILIEYFKLLSEVKASIVYIHLINVIVFTLMCDREKKI